MEFSKNVLHLHKSQLVLHRQTRQCTFGFDKFFCLGTFPFAEGHLQLLHGLLMRGNGRFQLGTRQFNNISILLLSLAYAHLQLFVVTRERYRCGPQKGGGLAVDLFLSVELLLVLCQVFLLLNYLGSQLISQRVDLLQKGRKSRVRVPGALLGRKTQLQVSFGDASFLYAELKVLHLPVQQRNIMSTLRSTGTGRADLLLIIPEHANLLLHLSNMASSLGNFSSLHVPLSHQLLNMLLLLLQRLLQGCGAGDLAIITPVRLGLALTEEATELMVLMEEELGLRFKPVSERLERDSLFARTRLEGGVAGVAGVVEKAFLVVVVVEGQEEV
ncbi:hypothetical protein EYF80_035196 [Liparis tanakae]|uniref:Uncharacterized protein n=1 Tax=Liparis tanakae TaxID=230148 RepID=A0A4Z2GM29_9TELE|nr:hypothetical protein EYF80_035196 [Liparis tanakae]